MSAVVALAVAAVVVVGCSAGWVVRDARARGLSTRKTLTWAALQGVEWPLFLWLYRRARPTRLRGETDPT
jgi:hypothetical protein